MHKLSLSRIEKICFAGMVILAALIVAVLIWWQTPQKQAENKEENKTNTLSTPEDKLPQKLYLGQVPPVTKLTDSNGKSVSLSAYQGRPVLILFWGSWCKYCKEQLDIAANITQIADSNGAQVLLIDKLDPEKETRKAALDELKTKSLSFPNLFDDGMAMYQAWGLKQIPTSVILDGQGKVAAYATGVLTAGEYKGLFEYAKKGGSAATAEFIKKNMMNQDGGTYCNVKIAGTTPGGHDVLSETQGLMMQYAVLSQNKTLFDSVWSFTRDKMEKKGLAAWYITKDGKPAGVNATLDDLRIWAALSAADSAWGGYSQAADTVRSAIFQNCVKDGRLVSFYEFASSRKSSSLPLCYADIAALRSLAQADANFSNVADNALETLQAGYISNNFPLYYASYDYGAKQYAKDDLNTAEALTTLWHLAQAKKLKPESLAWLKKQVSGGGLAARYHVDGSVVQGYEYHSTAVYALAALIAEEAGDRELYNASLQKMERYRNRDTDSGVYGAFGDPEAGDFPSFDQCMPLLVYAGKRP